MFGPSKRELAERIEKLERAVAGANDAVHQVKRMDGEIETLTKRVRELASGGILTNLIQEAVAKLDKAALVKEVTEALRAEAMAKANEAFQAALEDEDFVGNNFDEDRVEELIVEALVKHFSGTISVGDLTAKVAEELVQSDALDLGEIEQGVVDDVTERMEVSVKLSGNGQG